MSCSHGKVPTQRINKTDDADKDARPLTTVISQAGVSLTAIRAHRCTLVIRIAHARGVGQCALPKFSHAAEQQSY